LPCSIISFIPTKVRGNKILKKDIGIFIEASFYAKPGGLAITLQKGFYWLKQWRHRWGCYKGIQIKESYLNTNRNLKPMEF
jgi:hypothetical protein